MPPGDPQQSGQATAVPGLTVCICEIKEPGSHRLVLFYLINQGARAEAGLPGWHVC
jgi:hypothetical protein